MHILRSMEEEVIERKNPIWYLVAAFLLLLMVVSIFPLFAVKRNPSPTSYPEFSEVVPTLPVAVVNKSFNKGNYNSFLMPGDPMIKQVATRIATFGCDSNKICQAKAEYYFVRDNLVYVSEQDEYIQSAAEVLSTRGGDCDDHAVLLANLLRAIGIPTKFVFVPRHVFIMAYIKDAPGKYSKDGWIFLDPTCKECQFGEIMWQFRESEVRYS